MRPCLRLFGVYVLCGKVLLRDQVGTEAPESSQLSLSLFLPPCVSVRVRGAGELWLLLLLLLPRLPRSPPTAVVRCSGKSDVSARPAGPAQPSKPV